MAPHSSAQTAFSTEPVVFSFAEALSSKPHDFLGPSASLFAQTTAALKHYLDSLASSTVQLQDLQQSLQRKQKRKRTETAPSSSSKRLQLREVHVNGFNVRQVWEQTQRVLDISSAVTKEQSELRLPKSGSKAQASSREGSPASEQTDSARFDEEGGSEEDVASITDDREDVESAAGVSDEEEENEDGESGEEFTSKSRPVGKANATSNDGRPGQKQPPAFVRDRHGLNDGFFSIDEFNKQSLLFEELDTRRAKNDDVDSDEEDIDYDADPFMLGEPGSDDSEEDQDELNDDKLEEEGLDGNMDEEDDMSGIDEDARHATYEGFFDPPDLERLKKEALAKGQSRELSTGSDLDAGVERAMADVHRDLFDDEDSDLDGGAGASIAKGKKAETNMSTHEKARAGIIDEIRKLEAANVAKREWTLIGEAKANDRPLNSLIEEDLDFERVGKPVPVITAEVTDEIEELIKRRIVAKEFDDILRRPPPGLGDYTHAKSKFVLDETKPQQSLAELYEVDHLRATDQNYVSKKDEKLQKERDEVTQLWNNICSQLDTLCNLHFRPKQPSANVRVVADVDTIVMEDVRPSGGDGLASAGTLAPQEVYAPGEQKQNGEIVTKGGAAVAREEMSREEKLRHRRREKQKKRKKLLKTLEKPESAAAQKQQLISNLGKGGVRVIGKDGALTDVRGQKVAESTKPVAQTALKL